MLLLCTLYYFPLVKQVSVTTTAAVMELLITNKAVAKSGSSTASIRKKKKNNPAWHHYMPLQAGFVVQILLWWSERIFRGEACFFSSMTPYSNFPGLSLF